MFERVATAPADPILGLTDAYKADPRPEKINLGVGVFKDEQGNTPILESVKEAERRLVNSETTKGYLAISGSPEYGTAVQKLLLGADSELLKAQRVCTAQAPGGTGALRIGAEFLVRQLGVRTIWVSDPTWANHNAIFTAAGLTVKTYRYFDAETRGLDIDGMLADLAQIDSKDAVVLHGCCHNPSGVDPTIAQWRQIGATVKQSGAMPFFDFAYQGFGDGIDEDAAGLRMLVAQMRESLIANSFSKNFGLYNERIGALTVISADQAAKEAVLSQLKVLIRALYSNPPAHGALIVSTVLNDPDLCARWQKELAVMRERINGLRSELVEGLKAAGVQRDFSFIAEQKGMFSFSGLTKPQVEKLRDDYGIYIVGSGRINVAGIRKANLQTLCKAIAEVL